MIKHIWFDFSETIASIQRERHNKLRHDSYSSVTGKPVTPELIAEFEELASKHPNNNAGFFKSLGMPANFWSDQVNSLQPGELYKLKDENIPQVLSKLSAIVPISIFSNINLEKILPAFDIDSKLFSHILSAGMVKAPKPALDGFHKIIELSNLLPEEILYVGDDMGKDIIPAKKVGMQTGLIWSDSDGADYNFKNFIEILELLK
jgi:HAD superfamily hydrolase (TIGR01549 family)